MRAMRTEGALRELREDIAQMLRLLQLRQDAIVGLDGDQKIQFLNQGAENIFGYPAAALIGRPVSALLSSGPLPIRMAQSGEQAVAVWAGGEDKPFRRLVGLRETGQEFPVDASISSFLYGGKQTLVVIFRDATEQVETERRLRYLAEHDPLTQLPNRAVFLDRLCTGINRARRHGWHMALLYIDLDEFKPVNDSLGHAAGDDALRVAAARLALAVRDTDTVARFGGDEFTAILEDVRSPNDAMEVAVKMRALLAAPFVAAGKHLRLTASVGISLCPQHGTEASELLSYAEQAMYTAKGRGGTKIYAAETSRPATLGAGRGATCGGRRGPDTQTGSSGC